MGTGGYRWTIHLRSNEREEWHTLPLEVVEHFSNWRFLRNLLDSAPDGFDFERRGNKVHYVGGGPKDIPWHDDLGKLIEKHFHDDILAVMPEGLWDLGVVLADEGE